MINKIDKIREDQEINRIVVIIIRIEIKKEIGEIHKRKNNKMMIIIIIMEMMIEFK